MIVWLTGFVNGVEFTKTGRVNRKAKKKVGKREDQGAFSILNWGIFIPS